MRSGGDERGVRGGYRGRERYTVEIAPDQRLVRLVCLLLYNRIIEISMNRIFYTLKVGTLWVKS